MSDIAVHRQPVTGGTRNQQTAEHRTQNRFSRIAPASFPSCRRRGLGSTVPLQTLPHQHGVYQVTFYSIS